MSQPFSSEAGRSSLSDRRTSHRGPVQTKARLTVLHDAAPDGASHDILTREASLSGITFLLRESLSVGQKCRIEFDSNGHAGKRYLAEIVRSRPISGGRYEMAMEFRKPL